ncbi:MAG: hypothetical protein ACQEWM_03835 [Actinomycetota bacterium]
MPAGDTEREFREAALADGIVLERAAPPWITRRGHFGLPPAASGVAEILHHMFVALGGDAECQSRKTSQAIRGDWFHAPSRTFIEVDEVQHHTSDRLRTLEFYPSDHPAAFSVPLVEARCLAHAERAARSWANKHAACFDWPGGRRAQRAYNDALRDLVTPLMGYPPVLRVPAIGVDGGAAYLSARETIRLALEL